MKIKIISLRMERQRRRALTGVSPEHAQIVGSV